MGLAKYQRLVEELEHAIVSGRFTAGAKLPSVRELMGLNQLSLTTVTTALAILEQKDLVEARARSGYFVKDHSARGAERSPSQHDDPSHGFHWRPDPTLFPRERLRKFTATTVRRFPDLAIESAHNHNRRLQGQIANRCAEIGCFVYESDILITHGVTEALSVALRSTTQPGDSVLVQAPVSPLYRAIAASLCLALVEVDMMVPEVEWLESLHAATLANPGVRVALLASHFHCPTGNSLSLAGKQRTLELAQQRDLLLIEDDSCGDLQFAKARPIPIKGLDREGRVLYLTAATKAFAPGLRVGWIVSNSNWHKRLEEIKSISSSAVDYLPQLVLAEFLSKGAHLHHLRKLRALLAQRVGELERELREVQGDLSGLGGREGGFIRFLRPRRDLPAASELAVTGAQRWPELFSDGFPLIRFMEGGASLNLSFQPSGSRLQQLLSCVSWLSSL